MLPQALKPPHHIFLIDFLLASLWQVILVCDLRQILSTPITLDEMRLICPSTITIATFPLVQVPLYSAHGMQSLRHGFGKHVVRPLCVSDGIARLDFRGRGRLQRKLQS